MKEEQLTKSLLLRKNKFNRKSLWKKIEKRTKRSWRAELKQKIKQIVELKYCFENEDPYEIQEIPQNEATEHKSKACNKPLIRIHD